MKWNSRLASSIHLEICILNSNRNSCLKISSNCRRFDCRTATFLPWLGWNWGYIFQLDSIKHTWNFHERCQGGEIPVNNWLFFLVNTRVHSLWFASSTRNLPCADAAHESITRKSNASISVLDILNYRCFGQLCGYVLARGQYIPTWSPSPHTWPWLRPHVRTCTSSSQMQMAWSQNMTKCSCAVV